VVFLSVSRFCGRRISFDGCLMHFVAFCLTAAPRESNKVLCARALRDFLAWPRISVKSATEHTHTLGFTYHHFTKDCLCSV
jgi:hypothetical protein